MFKGKRVLGLICARGGSKGVPKKNIRPLGGRPLIGWSIESAKTCDLIDRIVVSTDDEEIARVAEHYGANVPFIRPEELARDNSPEWFVWQHALRKLGRLDNFRPDYLIVLPPTAPFRSHDDIRKSLEVIRERDVDIVISVTEANRNPYFNMVELDSNGFANLVNSPEGKVVRRQDAPEVFDMTTVLYTARTEFILKANGIFEGNVRAIMIPQNRALDIDTEMDFKFAEFLISEGLVK